MSTFVAALDSEIADLAAQLRTDPRFVKLQELQRVRALYGALPVSEPPTLPNLVLLTPAENVARGRKMSPDREKALDAARKHIKGRIFPTGTSEIYDVLIEQGIKLTGNNPINNLSAMLSNAPDFTSHGRRGWTLESSENVEAAGGTISRGDTPAASSDQTRLTNGSPRAQGREAVPGGGT